MMDDKNTLVFDIGAEDAFVALFAVAVGVFVALLAAVAVAGIRY